MECLLTFVNIGILVLIAYRCFNMRQERFTVGDDRVILFWSSKCIWCRKLKDREWPEFLKRAAAAKIRVQEVQLDASVDENAKSALALLNRPMPGVPYIIRSKNGVVVEYNGPRTADSLISWSRSQ